ncbi:unnamed protein product [Gongylonema pulchrum]|uniref:Na_H_Exchanger domain-containing protein n=1 Tax=Gongylonema pulchrum TaxID=637853 RepID=A0A183E2I3_9BILA|nr:unnamed protein product [Gongylonema pulchrum]
MNVFLLVVFHRRFVNPLQNVTLANPTYVDYGHSAISVVVIWIAAVALGYLTHIVGVLLCGILFRNIPAISVHIFIDDAISGFLRKAALTVILIRGGIGLDPEALKNCRSAILRLGIISPIIEAVVITVLAVLIFHMDVRISLIFGMALAATSPAVTIPTMLGLSKKGYGAHSGVPTVLLAAAAIDNMICLTVANILLAIVFSSRLFFFFF